MIDNIVAAIEREGPDSVAAVIAEPVQGAGGVYPPPDDYFPRLRDICDRYDVLLIADEVINPVSDAPASGSPWSTSRFSPT